MTANLSSPCHYAFISLLLLSSACVAQENNDALSLAGSAELGAEYNSNITITELESAYDTSDTAALFEGELTLSWQPAERLTAEGGYNLSSRRFQNASDFDLDMHLVYGDIGYDFDLLTLGLNTYYADVNLGGDGFLGLGQYSLYAGKLFLDQWYVRGALNFSDKSFDQFTARDADNDGYSLDAFWFFNQGRSSLMAGYKNEEERTQGSAFVYDGNTLQVRFSHRFSLGSKDARFRIGMRQQDRDYLYITPSIGEQRDDRQRVTQTRLQVQLNDRLAVIGRVELGDYQSNLPSADFTDNRVALSVKASF